MTEKVNMYDDEYYASHAGTLTEYGILVGKSEIIVEGKILDYARENGRNKRRTDAKRGAYS